jgi:hypothetical protein
VTISTLNDFAVVVPVAITDAMLTSSNVVETAGVTDPAAWNAATAYTAGQQVTRIGTNQHAIYQRLVNGTTATAPESDTVNWVYVKPTNRRCMFDTVNYTQTSNADSIVVSLTPNTVADALIMENLDANSVNVSVASSTYNKTVKTKVRACTGLYDWLFQRFRYRKCVAFLGMPPYKTNVITATITKTGSTAKCGTLVIGKRRAFGGAKYGASAGILDYTKKNTDQFGNTTAVAGAYSKRMNLYVLVPKDFVPTLHQLLADYRATPVFFLGAGDLYEQLVIYGYYRGYEDVISIDGWSIVSIQIEGLT